MSAAASITKQLADLLVKERAIRAAMRAPVGREKYEEYDRQLIDLERKRQDLEDELEALNGRALARGLSC